MRLNLKTGRSDQPPISTKRLGDLGAIYGGVDDPRRVVYEIYGEPNGDEHDPPKLLHATTVLYPGTANGKPFMTRGHFHVRPDRGEIVLTLAGEGRLLLVDRTGETRVERMVPGIVSDIDGRWAHRVVNVGEEPLAFFVTWMSDCGHEYGEIAFPSWEG